ncbi:MAG: adenylate/guanylate cyclase domain-containing protein, partial [Planctomycetaceae bacterium]|nr:adenylate/guanylate cyclase domain-containing protein [Planctomycetaceae bacterium]
AHLSKKHRCIFDKLQGDGALFITGIVDDSEKIGDAACRATAFALELCEEFASVVERWHGDNAMSLSHMPGVRMGVGIHVGQATTGVFVNAIRTEFIAFGNVVNSTHRIESAAGKGHGDVLVSAAVLKLIKGSYVCDVLKRMNVKDGAVYASAVLAAKPESNEV